MPNAASLTGLIRVIKPSNHTPPSVTRLTSSSSSPPPPRPSFLPFPLCRPQPKFTRSPPHIDPPIRPRNPPRGASPTTASPRARRLRELVRGDQSSILGEPARRPH
ncbi:hypothetical protein DAI22_03g034600 [Oryza sativa Japonica Group]|nr:hypothetical protein DAI22_03g034600 [Oryza sativa Japonica Group]